MLFVHKDEVAWMNEELRKLRKMIEDFKYELNTVKDTTALKKDTESMLKELSDHQHDIRIRIDSLENLTANLRRQLDVLRKEKHANATSMASQVGSDNNGASLELEEDLAKLRSDFESHKNDVFKRLREFDSALNDKASKHDLELLEQQLLSRL